MKDDDRAAASEPETRYEEWARLAAQFTTLRPLPPDASLMSVEDVLLEQLAPAPGGELRGAPAYLNGSLPSRFWRAISSLAYALFLPVWPRPGEEDRPMVVGEEGPEGIVLRVYHGPPTYEQSFVLCDALEELACTDRESLRRLWRKLDSVVSRAPSDDG